jgi:F0F1-type ATP synthase delta subunit
VVATFTVDPDLLGGMVVRYGDEILDGSVRTGAENLRRRLVAAVMPREKAAAAA